MIHSHITTWVIALILFFVALGLHKSGKAQGVKVMHMILRLFYLLIIGTGIWMLMSISNVDFQYILKTIVGVWVIAVMEMTLVRTVKGEKTTSLWVQFVISLLLVFYLGFVRLPLTFLV